MPADRDQRRKDVLGWQGVICLGCVIIGLPLLTGGHTVRLMACFLLVWAVSPAAFILSDMVRNHGLHR